MVRTKTVVVNKDREYMFVWLFVCFFYIALENNYLDVTVGCKRSFDIVNCTTLRATTSTTTANITFTPTDIEINPEIIAGLKIV